MESWQRIDEADEAQARELLWRCCGSTAWVSRMLHSRPFTGNERLLTCAREEWFALSRSDWLEAFSHHPRIGDRDALRRRFAGTRDLSQAEQKGVDGASEDVLTALAEGNHAYERRFGYIFIVCATGRGAEAMLSMLQTRLANTPETEIQIAAAEQARITELRLLGLSGHENAAVARRHDRHDDTTRRDDTTGHDDTA